MLNLAKIALKRLQTPWKQTLYTQQEKVSRFYYFFPYFELFCTIDLQPRSQGLDPGNEVDRFIPIAITQCHVDGAQRAWATYGFKILLRNGQE